MLGVGKAIGYPFRRLFGRGSPQSPPPLNPSSNIPNDTLTLNNDALTLGGQYLTLGS